MWFSSEIAQGNLTCELNINRNDEIGQVADTLKNTSYELRNSVVLEVFNASNIMEEKAYTTSNSIKEVAGVTEENSSATEEVTAANCRNNK